MSDQNKNYTVGWICAISTELVAARNFLDEKHEGPVYVTRNDANSYTLGRIGEHNVVIACLPNGEYGIASAASVAKDMQHSFPHTRIGLMVGIGGGAPSEKHDIRLGDIVVSTPCGNDGGVFQYDFGKTIQGQRFQTTGFLNKPPSSLLTAVSTLKAEYEIDGHQLECAISNILEKKSRLRKKYKRPDPSTDRLYQNGFIHPSNGEASRVATCAETCDKSQLVPRLERLEEDDNPAIHYGLIASANQLMKNASIRDELSAERNVLCFEMEAAGLMNTFPCLVIRGICDYSDSHKNKEWQGYAAMTAAAYAKDLLCKIHPRRVEAEKKISEVLSGLQEIAADHRDITRMQLELQQDTAKQKMSDKQKTCLQLFRLTKSTEDATYEWYKDRVEDRVEGTCEWFLRHNHFREWLKRESGPLLVSADPGCGKSVLAKYLIDRELPGLATICYFFFKDQDQNTVRQALCALLHQLFSQKPSLIQHAMKPFDENGPGLVNSTKSLWTILGDAVRDPEAGPVIMVLDALDECDTLELEDLVWNMEAQFQSNQSGYGKLKYLLTSRPYEQIVSKFWRLLDAFPQIRIPGEEESENISGEVNLVIQYRVKRLAREKVLSDQVKRHLENRLLEIQHRTYLWVYLVFDYLSAEDFKKTPKGVDSTIDTMPKNINEAYEQILNKSTEHSAVRKAMGIILAAARPLTLSEMNVAMNIDNTSESIYDLDLEEEEDFKIRLRSWCGLFVSIYQGKVHFLHQTAREFLVTDLPSSTTLPTKLHWHHSITMHDAHRILAEPCVRYLNFFNFEASLPTDTSAEASPHIDRRAFLDYSAQFWALHFREAHISNDDATITSLVLGISDPYSRAYSVWFQIYRDAGRHIYLPSPGFSTGLMVASYFGHSDVTKLLVDKDPDLESTDQCGMTSLSWAAMQGYEMIVKLLLEKGVNLEPPDAYGRTPLSWAAENRHETVVELLLEKSTDMGSADQCGMTSLSWASLCGYQAVIKLLLEKGVNLESKDQNGRTSLLLAAQSGHEAVVKLLLEKGANLESKDADGMTPLSWAAMQGHETVVKLLLENSANLKSKDEHGTTSLSWAAMQGHETVVKLLLEKGANPKSKDEHGMTSLSWAAMTGQKTVAKLLLEKGANLESKDKGGRTSLSWAAECGDETVFKLLLENGANGESEDKYGGTPLLYAAEKGYKVAVKLLHEKNTEKSRIVLI
ncbi:hypothetical protein EMPG_11994 [Blastomyces silverae]|uniref:Uncharacterized protein n=1 Tax=Blastomyces silverae TaxID=2060906 RepID=A0A0H1BPS9_9EURO|nr:hypothetical protein EMPG_11994 [Blastomyces silverae]